MKTKAEFVLDAVHTSMFEPRGHNRSFVEIISDQVDTSQITEAQGETKLVGASMVIATDAELIYDALKAAGKLT